MSHPSSQQLSHTGDNDHRVSEAQNILSDLHALRNRIVVAWQERGVMLTPEEQQMLRDEIKATCTFLTDLTVSS